MKNLRKSKEEFEPHPQTEAITDFTAEDYPVEDMFGSEIQFGDKWFQDQAGRIVIQENAEKYLTEVGGVEFFRAI